MMPHTPEALANGPKSPLFTAGFRQRFVLLIVAVMLVMQFLTWRAIEEMRRDFTYKSATMQYL